MSVDELIVELQKIKDKSRPVIIDSYYPGDANKVIESHPDYNNGKSVVITV